MSGSIIIIVASALLALVVLESLLLPERSPARSPPPRSAIDLHLLSLSLPFHGASSHALHIGKARYHERNAVQQRFTRELRVGVGEQNRGGVEEEGEEVEGGRGGMRNETRNAEGEER